jgi:hypothetical protein
VSETGESVRLGDWLASRVPSPPPSLSERIADAVGDSECERAHLSSTLVDHAEALLKTVGNDRSSADDLLVADALITYAMEAAADDCEKLEAIASRVAYRISATAAEPTKQ